MSIMVHEKEPHPKKVEALLLISHRLGLNVEEVIGKTG